eukprot:8791304-Alexandrium_andersonii.AAC.1
MDVPVPTNVRDDATPLGSLRPAPPAPPAEPEGQPEARDAEQPAPAPLSAENVAVPGLADDD